MQEREASLKTSFAALTTAATAKKPILQDNLAREVRSTIACSDMIDMMGVMGVIDMMGVDVDIPGENRARGSNPLGRV